MMRISGRMNSTRVRCASQANFRTDAATARILLLALLLSAGGCASLGKLPFLPGAEQIPEATAADPVVEALCLWQPAEGRGVDGLPTRGFAGQILFFTRKSASPVKVNGDVRIYLFENRGTASDQSKPIHQFDFLGEVWNRHLQKGTLGPSYHVFVPYVKSHPWQTEGSLRVRLTPKVGAAIYSDLATVMLPGAEEPGQPDDSVEAATGVVRQSLQRKAADQQTAELKKSMRTSSISMGAGSSAEARMTETRSGLPAAPAVPQAETVQANAVHTNAIQTNGMQASGVQAHGMQTVPASAMTSAEAIQEAAARLQALQAQALLESRVRAAGAATVQTADVFDEPAASAGGIQQVSSQRETSEPDEPADVPTTTRSRRFQLRPAAGASATGTTHTDSQNGHPLSAGRADAVPQASGSATSPHPLAGLE